MNVIREDIEEMHVSLDVVENCRLSSCTVLFGVLCFYQEQFLSLVPSLSFFLRHDSQSLRTSHVFLIDGDGRLLYAPNSELKGSTVIINDSVVDFLEHEAKSKF